MSIELSTFDNLVEVMDVLFQVFYFEFELTVLLVYLSDLQGVFVYHPDLLCVCDLQFVVLLLNIRNCAFHEVVLLLDLPDYLNQLLQRRYTNPVFPSQILEQFLFLLVIDIDPCQQDIFLLNTIFELLLQFVVLLNYCLDLLL